MRRAIFVILAGGALAALTTLVGCPAAHDDYPGAACKTDSDCYEGEHCLNQTLCVLDTPDMAVRLPDLAHFFGDGGGPDLLSPDDMSPVDL